MNDVNTISDNPAAVGSGIRRNADLTKQQEVYITATKKVIVQLFDILKDLQAKGIFSQGAYGEADLEAICTRLEELTTQADPEAQEWSDPTPLQNQVLDQIKDIENKFARVYSAVRFIREWHNSTELDKSSACIDNLIQAVRQAYRITDKQYHDHNHACNLTGIVRDVQRSTTVEAAFKELISAVLLKPNHSLLFEQLLEKIFDWSRELGVSLVDRRAWNF